MSDPQPLDICIAALGSHGDVHPFLGIAKALVARGHRVRFIAPAPFESLVKALKIDFVAIGTVDDFERMSNNPDLWKGSRAMKVIADGVAMVTEGYYRAIAQWHIPGQSVVVHSTLAFGARIAQEKLRIPTVSVHLAPAIIRSLLDPPYLPPLVMYAWQPMWFKRLLYGIGDRFFVDPLLGPALNSLRASLGMAPVKGIFKDWIHSPDRVIGLFPPWYAPPAVDWPGQCVVTGFPLYDEADVTPVQPRLLEFLDAGDPPIAFTPGSAMRHGKDFFRAAVQTCRLLGRRGLLLSRHAQNVPDSLPERVLHESFAPFGTLLPRCAALVHHGGIGTCAQGLASGLPQLVMPMAHDQPDNARRLDRLGVAAVVPAPRFTAERAAQALDDILDRPSVVGACMQIKRQMAQNDAIAKTVGWIESAHPSNAPPRG